MARWHARDGAGSRAVMRGARLPMQIREGGSRICTGALLVLASLLAIGQAGVGECASACHWRRCAFCGVLCLAAQPHFSTCQDAEARKRD